MGPSPVTIFENNAFPVGQNMLRQYRNVTNGWDSNIWDPTHPRWDPTRVVGGHMPVGKRNSTPVGPPPPPMAPMRPAVSRNVLPPMFNGTNAVVAAAAAVAGQANFVQHRPIDRCFSEPLRNVNNINNVNNITNVTNVNTTPENETAGMPELGAERYKTELCRSFAENGFCKYGDKCQFAHGTYDMRYLPRHPKYKTMRCRTFHSTGLCVYGMRCHFIHNPDEVSLAGNSPPSSSAEISPPLSLNGSPTSNAGAFFGDAFSMFPQPPKPPSPPLTFSGLLTPPSMMPTVVPVQNNYSMMETPHPMMGTPHPIMETPPVSPVESISGELESLSISPPLSTSPPLVDQGMNAQTQRCVRLPIFENMKETTY